MIEVVSPIVFGGVSLIAGVLNLIFLLRASRNYSALVEARNQDPTMRRIGTGFIAIWGFIIFADAIRVAVGAGVFLHQPRSIYLLMLSPFASLLVAIVGLRSFR